MDVTFSPDGRRLAVASRRMIKLLDAATGEEALVLRGVAHARPDNNGFNPRVRFSPDGKRIAAICHDLRSPVSLWSVEEEAARDPAARLRAADRRAVAAVGAQGGEPGHARNWFYPVRGAQLSARPPVGRGVEPSGRPLA
jgi:hypothetical protein